MDEIERLSNLLIDSREGMEYLAEWARAHNAVLSEAHERMASKHGVSLDGIVISRPIPLST